MKISTVEEMRQCDLRAIKTYGIEDMLLMENAGNAVYYLILKHMGKISNKKFIVFSGPGNNGGDALVTSRKLFSNGAEVKIYLMCSPEKYSGSARMNYEIANKIGIPMEEFVGDNALMEFTIEHADAIIDGILGTGISRNIAGKYADAIRIINNSGKIVFSVDIPSGINGNNGRIMGSAVHADYTATFGLPKIGNIIYPGYEHCGKLYVSHISFPPANCEESNVKIEINTPVQITLRKRDGHKGTFGDALFVAGAKKYYGAPYFSAISFLKTGGGYARLATAKSVVPFVGTEGREIVFYPLEETESGTIAYASLDEILDVVDIVDFVVIGPGISLNESTQKLIRDLIPRINKPLLIDGDGLTALASGLKTLKERDEKTVITPHPGEMARLLKLNVSEVMKEHIVKIRNFAKKYSTVVVFKGAHTRIAMPDGKVYINMTGNSGMATAGSGDVLTGTIAAMYGLGLNFENAVRMGVFVHGLAGDIASEYIGEDGLTARDIMEYLPDAMELVRNDYEELLDKYEIEVI